MTLAEVALIVGASAAGIASTVAAFVQSLRKRDSKLVVRLKDGNVVALNTASGEDLEAQLNAILKYRHENQTSKPKADDTKGAP